MIYLDNAGTTKMFDECVAVHQDFSCNKFYNPSAMSIKSSEISKQILETEKFFLNKLGTSQGNILFTSCATESNNLAIKGSLRSGNYEYVFSCGEHASVYNTARKIELDGKIVHFVPLTKEGVVDLEALEKVLNERTRLISVIHVSNETGAINDLIKISSLKNKLCPKSILHVDGVQGFMKIPFALRDTSIDLYSFSAHKLHGPKGIAGLYVKNKSSLKELFEGGGQQYELRSGTENVSGIMQFKKAIELIDINKNLQHTLELKNRFNKQLNESGIQIVDFNGSPYIECLMFDGVKGETMLHALESKGVIVGLGSACSSKKLGNRVLEQIGFPLNKIISSIRISFNAYMEFEEVEMAAKIICDVYKDIKQRVQK